MNDVLKNIVNPAMPFGGEKHSGMGRYHGPEGLRAFSRQISIMQNPGILPTEINWFPYTSAGYGALRGLIRSLFGPGPAERAKARVRAWLSR